MQTVSRREGLAGVLATLSGIGGGGGRISWLRAGWGVGSRGGEPSVWPRHHSDVASPFFRERAVPIDDIPKLKLLVRNALRARAWFSRQGPAWAELLPLSEDEHETILCSGFFHRHLVAHYSYSLQGRDFDYLGHPLFFDFARGVMASSHVGERGLRTDLELLAEFPPKPLAGLDEQAHWRPLPNRASKLIETPMRL